MVSQIDSFSWVFGFIVNFVDSRLNSLASRCCRRLYRNFMYWAKGGDGEVGLGLNSGSSFWWGAQLGGGWELV